MAQRDCAMHGCPFSCWCRHLGRSVTSLGIFEDVASVLVARKQREKDGGSGDVGFRHGQHRSLPCLPSVYYMRCLPCVCVHLAKFKCPGILCQIGSCNPICFASSLRTSHARIRLVCVLVYADLYTIYTACPVCVCISRNASVLHPLPDRFAT